MTIAEGSERDGSDAPVSAVLARLRTHPIASAMRDGMAGLLSVCNDVGARGFAIVQQSVGEAGARGVETLRLHWPGQRAPSRPMEWTEIPGWFRWRSGQREAVAHFPDGGRFVEVGTSGRRNCAAIDSSCAPMKGQPL